MSGWQIAGSEAARGGELLADRFGEQSSTMIVLFTDPDGNDLMLHNRDAPRACDDVAPPRARFRCAFDVRISC